MTKRLISLLLAVVMSLFGFTACTEPDFFEETTATETQDVQGPSTVDGSFAIHFIDVGQADAALVICGGKTMLIDGGNAEDSNLIYAYLQREEISHLDYVVCTHAHEDHVGGLSGALTAATAGRVMAPVTTYDTKTFQNFVSKAEARGCTVEIPKPNDSFSLGDATVTVLGPLVDYEDTNNTSIVLRIVYGGTSFLFTGDMETDAENDLLNAGVTLKSTVLKVGHHGSSTSTSYRFLREVAPEYAVISVGEDNQYGHPHDNVLSRLRDADVTLYRTDLQGDIICTSNGSSVSFATSKGKDAVTNPTESDKTESDGSAVTEYAYIGNLGSKIYHKTDCSSLPKEENRIYFTTEQEAQSNGYRSCSKCIS